MIAVTIVFQYFLVLVLVLVLIRPQVQAWRIRHAADVCTCIMGKETHTHSRAPNVHMTNTGIGGLTWQGSVYSLVRTSILTLFFADLLSLKDSPKCKIDD
jgi:hypothetical protein